VLFNTPSVQELAPIIAQTIVPAFLLGALASFLSVLTTRLSRVVDQIILLKAMEDQEIAKRRIPNLKRRAALAHRAIFWAIVSAIIIAAMVVVAFASAFANIQHERGVAIMFILALIALIVALVSFACETRIASRDIQDLA
jgi:uncharacterized membrane protein YgcG